MTPEDRSSRLLWACAAAAFALLVLEATQLDFYVEEPRRVMVAQGMLDEGFGAAPKILGDPYLKKPPGYNWALALVSWPAGVVNEWSARSLSLAVWVGLGVGVVAVSRRQLSARGRAVAAAALLLNLVVVVEKAALAEIDLFLTLLLFAGAWSWFALWERGRPNLAWGVGHLWLGAALLTKGPVAYPFFYVPTLGFLFWERRLAKRGERPADAEGPGFGAAGWLAGVVGAHAVMLWWLLSMLDGAGVSLDSYLAVVGDETAGRSARVSLLDYLGQLLEAPFLLFGSLLPFSVLFAFLVDHDTRRRVWQRTTGSRWGRFVWIGLPPLLLLLLPASRVRYVLPAFPAAALWLGLISEEIDADTGARWLSRVLQVFAVLFFASAVLPWTLADEHSLLSPLAQGIASLGLVLGGAGLIALARGAGFQWNRGIAGLALAAVLLKAGHLFVYLPQHDVEAFSIETHVSAWAAELRARGIERVVNESGDLSVAYYLGQHGIEVVGPSQRASGAWMLAGRAGDPPGEWLEVPGMKPTRLYQAP